MKLLPLAFLAVLSCCTAAHAAPAAADTDAAKLHFEKGQALSAALKYREALAEFAAGYELSRRPLFLFNMGECARLAGDLARAKESFERYLAEDPNGKLAEQARSRVEELATRLPARPAPVAPKPGPPPKKAQPPHPAPPPALIVVAPQTPSATSPPIWKRWPFWTGVGLVAGAGTVAVYAGTRSDAGCGAACSEVDLSR